MTFNQIFQSSYPSRRGVAYLGQVAGDAPECFGKVARGLLKAGYGCFKVQGVGGAGAGMDPGECYQIPSPDAGADDDAIRLSAASPTSDTVYTTGTGVVGLNEMQPPRKITLTVSSHANWNATTAVLKGVDSDGKVVTENLAIPDDGDATITSTKYYMNFISITIPTQGGASGTFTVGVAALASLALADFLGVVRRTDIKTTLYTSALYGMPGIAAGTQTADYVDNNTVPIVRKGDIWVFTEEALSDRDPVYCRVAANGGNTVLGAFRNDADSASCILIPDARVVGDYDAGMARIRLAHNG